MQLNRNTGLAVLFIGLGAIIVLSKLGVGFHGFIGLLISIALVVLGVIGIRNGKSLIGWAMLIIGGIMLLGKLSGLIVLLIAAGLIIYGFNMLKKRKDIA